MKRGMLFPVPEIIILIIIISVISACSTSEKSVESETPSGHDYLTVVQNYADTMIEYGRDMYGTESSPLFATTLNRKTLKMFNGEELETIRSITRDSWGIRPNDRMLTGANPMHDQNLYQILYNLSHITGDKRYAGEADKALQWFFENCRSEKTGLMAWGEHMGWDFNTETIIDKKQATTHEFFRPWILWKRSYKLAPQSCTAFARGLWDHQIYDGKSGNFSRHARWDEHGPGTNNEYPRHGGFYIAAWAEAYEQTKDRVYLEAIETLLDYYNNRRNEISGAIPCCSTPERIKIIWPESNLSFAIDLWDAAYKVPEELGRKMRESASITDGIYLKLKHDFTPNGNGFVAGANADTLEPFLEGSWTHSQKWAAEYGKCTDAQIAMLCYLRYQQVKKEGYSKLVVDAAARYLDSKPPTGFPVYPGVLGDAINLMLAAYELTGVIQFLDRADIFGNEAMEIFFKNSPLPSASSMHDHYEAVTRGDSLVLSLLKLWLVKNRPDLKLNIVYSDR